MAIKINTPQSNPVNPKDSNDPLAENGKYGTKFTVPSTVISIPTNRGDSYGAGYTPISSDIYGGLQRHKAETQSNWEKFGNVLARGIPKAAMSMIEPIGFLLDVEQYTTNINQVEEEYGNAFNRALMDIDTELNEQFPIYTKEEQPTIGTSDWFFKNGDQIIKSLGYFVPGMAFTKGASALINGVTSALKISRAFNIAGKAVDIAGVANRVGSPLVAAIAQNYGEHMMSAIPAFAESKKAYLQQNLDSGEFATFEAANTDAKLRASQDAESILDGGKINILFNFLEFSNLFSPLNATRRATEMTRKGVAKAIASTAGSEYAEEVTTGYFEDEARRRMLLATGQIQDDGTSGLDRYLEHLGSYEGLTEGLLGAIGGAGMQVISTVTNIPQARAQRERIKQNISELGSPTARDIAVFNELDKRDFYSTVFDNLDKGTMDDVYRILDGYAQMTEEEASEAGVTQDYVEKAIEFKAAAQDLEVNYNELNNKYKDNPLIANSLIFNRIEERENAIKAKQYDEQVSDIKKEYTSEEKQHPLFNAKQLLIDREAVLNEIAFNEQLLQNIGEDERNVITNENAEEIEARSVQLYKKAGDLQELVNKETDNYIEKNAIKNEEGEVTNAEESIAKINDYLYTTNESGERQLNTSTIDDNLIESKALYNNAITRRDAANKVVKTLQTNPESLTKFSEQLEKQQEDRKAKQLDIFKRRISKIDSREELRNELRGVRNAAPEFVEAINKRDEELKDIEKQETAKTTAKEEAKTVKEQAKDVISKTTDKAKDIGGKVYDKIVGKDRPAKSSKSDLGIDSSTGAPAKTSQNVTQDNVTSTTETNKKDIAIKNDNSEEAVVNTQETIEKDEEIPTVPTKQIETDRVNDAIARSSNLYMVGNKDVQKSNGKINKVFDGSRLKVVNSATTIANLALDYRMLDEETIFTTGNKRLSNYNKLVETGKIKQGTKLRFSIDTELSFVDSEGKTKTYKDFKDDVNSIPIKIEAEVDGDYQDIGYLHTLNWVEENSAPVVPDGEGGVIDNIKIQSDKIKKIRFDLNELFKTTDVVEGKVTDKYDGHLNKNVLVTNREPQFNKDGKPIYVKGTVSKLLPGVNKIGTIFDDKVIMGEGVSDMPLSDGLANLNIASGYKLNGKTIVIGTNALGQEFIIPVNTPTISVLNKIGDSINDTLLNYFELLYTSRNTTEEVNNINEKAGDDIISLTSLNTVKNYLSQYVYIKSEAKVNELLDTIDLVINKDELQIVNNESQTIFRLKRPNGVPNFSISTDSGKTFRLSTEEVFSNAVKDYLGYAYINTDRTKLNSDVEFKDHILKYEGDVIKLVKTNTFNNYNEYLKDKLTTIYNATDYVEIDGKRQYLYKAQPGIEFDYNKIEVQVETEEDGKIETIDTTKKLDKDVESELDDVFGDEDALFMPSNTITSNVSNEPKSNLNSLIKGFDYVVSDLGYTVQKDIVNINLALISNAFDEHISTITGTETNFKAKETLDRVRNSFEIRLKRLNTVKSLIDKGNTLDVLNSDSRVSSMGITSIEKLDDYINKTEILLRDENWAKIVTHTMSNLDAIGFKNNISTFELQEVEGEDSTFEAMKFDEDARLTVDPKDKATPQFKLWLSKFAQVKNIDEQGNESYVLDSLGLPRYVDFDLMFNKILDILSSKGITKEEILTALEDAAKYDPTLKVIADELKDEANSRVLTQMINVMVKSKFNMIKTVMYANYEYGQRKGINLVPTYNNIKNSYLGVIDTWESMQSISDIVDFKLTEPEFIQSKIDNILSNYTKVYNSELDNINKGVISDKLKSGIKTALHNVGILVSDNVINDVFRSKNNVESLFENRLDATLNPDKSGLMGSIFKAFESKDTPLVSINNPFYNNSSRRLIKKLAEIQAQYDDRIYAMSSLNSDNKLIQNVQDYTYETNTVRRLKDINSRLHGEIRDTSFGKYSLVIERMLHETKGERFRSNFNIEFYDATQFGYNGKSIARSKMSNLLHDATALGLFHNRGSEIGKYIGITNGDSKLVPVYTMEKFKIEPSIVNGELRHIGNATSATYLFKLAKNEIDRIRNFQENILETPNAEYNKGANRFHLFDYLNKENLSEELRNKIWKGDKLILTVEDFNIVQDLIVENTLNSVNSYINELKNSGYLITNDDGKIDSEYMDIQYLNAVRAGRIGGRTRTLEDAIIYGITDFYINNMIFAGEQFLLINNDPAVYTNSKGAFSRERTFDNIIKRLKMTVSPRVSGNWEHSPTVKVVTVSDLITSNSLYDGITVSDGAELVTVMEAINFLKAYNKIDDRIYNKIKTKIKNAKDGNYILEQDELISINAIKPILRQSKNYEKDGKTYDVRLPFGRKSGAVVLHPNVTQGLDINRLRVVMETNGIGRLAFQTTDKTGAFNTNIDNIFDKDGRLKETIEFNNIRDIERTDSGLQLETPYGKDKIAVISQMDLLLMDSIRDLKGFEYKGKKVDASTIESEKERIRKELYELGKEELFDELGIIKVNDEYVYTEDSYIKIQKLLIEEGNARDWTLPDIQQLTLSKDNKSFEFPLIANNSYEKIQALLNNILTDRIIKLKIPGFSLIQTPDLGYRKTEVKEISELSDKDLRGIVYTEDFNNDKGLQGLEDNRSRSQILISWRFKDANGKLLNIKDYIKETKTGYVIDYNRLPKEILNSIAARIPNQQHSSMLPYEIAGFLPNYMEDTVVVANGITEQMGSDFDIDKLYAYAYAWYLHPVDKSFVKITRDDSILNLTEEGINKEIERIQGLLETRKKMVSKLDTMASKLNYDKPKQVEEYKKLEKELEEFDKTHGSKLIKDFDTLTNKSFKNIGELKITQLKDTTRVLKNDLTERNILYNEYQDVLNSVLTYPKVLDGVRVALDNNDIQTEVDLLRKDIGDNTNRDLLDWRTYRDSYKSQRDGQGLIGAGAIYNIFNSAIQKYNDLELTRLLKNGKIVSDSIEVIGEDNKTIKLDRIGGTAESTTKYTKEELIRSKSFNINNFLNMFVDNGNNANAGKINLNYITVNTALFSQLLQSGNNKSVGNAFAIRLLTQPSIIEYTKEVERITSEGNIELQQAKQQAFNNILSNYEYDETKHKYYPVSNEDLRNSRRNPNNKNQRNALLLFRKLDSFADSLNPITTVSLYGYRNGAGSSLTNVKEIMYKLRHSYFDINNLDYNAGVDTLQYTNTSFRNVHKILGTINKQGNLEYNTQLGKALIDSVALADLIYSPLFNLDSEMVDRAIRLYMGVTDKNFISGNQLQKLVSNLRASMFSGVNEIFNVNDLNSERYRLLYGTKELDGIVDKYFKVVEKYPNNVFLNKLEVVKVNNGTDPRLLKYDNTKGRNINEADNIQFLNDLIYNEDIELADFGKDLVLYSYLIGGIFSPISMTRFVDANYLKELGVHTRLTEFTNKMYNDDSLARRYIQQYLQHYPWEAKAIDIVGNEDIVNFSRSDFAKTNRKGEVSNHLGYTSFTIGSGFEKYGQYLNYKDNELGNQLFVESGEDVNGNIVYTRIDTLGSRYIKEFDLSKDIQTSIVPNNRLEGRHFNNSLIISNPERLSLDNTITDNKVKASDWFTRYFANNDNSNYLEDTLKAVKTPYNEVIAKTIRENLIRLNPKAIESTAVKFPKKFSSMLGLYNGNVRININKIKGNNIDFNELDTVLVHEGLHAITTDLIDMYLNTPDILMKYNARAYTIINNINKLFNEARKDINPKLLESIEGKITEGTQTYGTNLTEEERKNYGFASLYEFISETFTNKDFQLILNDLEYSVDKLDKVETPRSVLTKLLDLIKLLTKSLAETFGIEFNINPDSILNATLENSLNLIMDDGGMTIDTVVDDSVTNVKEDGETKEIGEQDIDTNLFSPNANQYNLFDNQKNYKLRVNEAIPKVKNYIIEEMLDKDLITKFKDRYYIHKSKTKIDVPRGKTKAIVNENKLLRAIGNEFLNISIYEIKSTKSELGREIIFSDAALREFIKAYNKLKSTRNNHFSFGNPIQPELNEEARRSITRIGDIISEINTQLTNTKRIENPTEYNRLSVLKENLLKDKQNIVESQTKKSIVEVANRQLDYVAYALDNKNLTHSELQSIKGVIDIWNIANSQNYMTDTELSNPEHSFYKELINVNERGIILGHKLSNIAKEEVLNVMKKYGLEAKAEELEQVEEIGALTSLTLSLDKVDNKLAQTIDKLLKLTNRNPSGKLQEYSDRITELFTKARMDSVARGLLKDNILHQKGKDGELTGGMVSQTSWKWDNLQNSITIDEINAERALTREDSPITLDEYKEKLRDIDRRLKNSAIIVDLGAIGKVSSKDGKYIKRTIDGVTYNNAAEYKKYLVSQLGETLANNAIEQAEDKYDKYLKDYHNYKQQVMEDPTTSEEQKTELLRDFETRYSPIIYLNHMYGTNPNLNLHRLKGKNYTVVLPKKYGKNGNDLGYYDKNFEKIANNSALLNLYNGYRDIMKEAIAMLPDSVSRDLPESFLAQVEHDIFATIREVGYKDAKKYMTSGIIDAITTGEVAELNHKADPIFARRNPNTGELRKGTPLRYIKPIQDMNKFSRDLENTLRLFVKMAVSYDYINTTRNTIEMIANVLDEARTIEISKNGNYILGKDGKIQTKEGGHEKLMNMVQHSIDAILSGQKTDKGQATKSKVYSLSPKEQRARKKKAQYIEFRNTEVQHELDELQSNIDTIDANTYNTRYAELTKELETLEKEYKDLGGKNLSLVNIGEKLMQLTQMKGLGLNITAGASNFFFGIISNMTHANGRVEFDNKHFLRAFKEVLTARGKKAGTNKVFNIVKRFDILFDVIDSRYSASDANAKTTIKMLKNFDLYVFQTKTEYAVQSQSFVATLMKSTIKDKNGNEMSLWDAMDDTGKLREGLFTEEQYKDWDNKVRADEENSYTKTRDKAIQLNKLLHGNYDPSSPLLGKRHILGRMLFMFRSWLPEGFANRFQAERYDAHLDRQIKGRWLTYGELGVIDSFKTLLKQIAYRNDAFVNNGIPMKPVDVENMRRNLVEVGVWSSLVTIGFLLKFALDELDDDDFSTGALRVLYNTLYRAEQDVTFYANPMTFYTVLRDPIPVSKVMTDLIAASTSTYRYINDDNYRGMNPAWKWSRNVPLINQINKIQYLASRNLDE